MGWEFGTVETSGIDGLAGMVEEGVELDGFGIGYSEANLSDEIELINNHLLKNLKLSGGLRLSNLGWGCQCRVG